MVRSPPLRTPTARIFVGALRAAGGDADGLIERHGLPASIERLPFVTVPLHAFRALVAEVAVLLADPDLGLHAAIGIRRGDFGLFEFVLRSAMTVGEGCRLCVRYGALFDELARMSIEEDADEARLDQRVPGEPLGAGRHANEFAIAASVRLVREVIGTDWRPRRVWFAHPCEHDAAPLAAFLGTDQIVFGAGSNGLAIGREDLARPIVSSDAALGATLELQARLVLVERPTTSDLLSTVREHIRRGLPYGAPQLETTAIELGLSDRTLQRRLAEAETTFHALVEDIRTTLSTVYLADPELSLGEISFQLGYAEPSTFMRAFKRWTGTTPGRYREQHAKVA